MAARKTNQTTQKDTQDTIQDTAKKTVSKETQELDQKVERSSIKKQNVDLNELITVKNGFQGRLVYVSKRTGEVFKWDRFGDEQEIDLRELKNIKSSAKGFFANNWFMFDEEYEWVIDYLGLSQFYKNSVKLNEFDEFFDGKTPEEIRSAVSKLSAGQKRSLSYKARELVMDGTIDSRRAIVAIEEAFDIELLEK